VAMAIPNGFFNTLGHPPHFLLAFFVWMIIIRA
jgi:hypothetical protein